jgi:UDP-N-acetyl-D-glucosamine/UDP-N-acetyl-D-galactosamine dehydrogenase
MTNPKIAIIGLGYVGLPLAVEFSKKYSVVGFDINKSRIKELENGFDRTRELSEDELRQAKSLSFSCDTNTIKDCTVYIVTVPTPIDIHKKPDLTPLLKASETVGSVLKQGDTIIYESTVYPGCTEEDCVPVLEKFSGFKYNRDFFCGYSPERINPGDKERTLTKILKITSGSTPEAADFVDNLYKSIIEAGTYRAASLKVAEAAKVIENCQRDINIAFVNELALMFSKIGLDTQSVLEAAGTKWNFLPFRPGLVGGHCIGVDPYYLTHKAEALGYKAEVILSGRRINDSMGGVIANKVVKLLIKNGKTVNQSKVLVLGITFKENCPDIRNTKVIDIIAELEDFGVKVEIYDPWADSAEVKHEYGYTISEAPDFNNYDGVILAVAHQDFLEENFRKKIETFKGVVYDVKGILQPEYITERL